MYLLEQGIEDPWLFFDARRGSRAKNFGKRLVTVHTVNRRLSDLMGLGGGVVLEKSTSRLFSVLFLV